MTTCRPPAGCASASACRSAGIPTCRRRPAAGPRRGRRARRGPPAGPSYAGSHAGSRLLPPGGGARRLRRRPGGRPGHCRGRERTRRACRLHEVARAGGRARAGVVLPGHGPLVADPAAKLSEYLAHRNGRERQVIEALAAGRRPCLRSSLGSTPDVSPELRGARGPKRPGAPDEARRRAARSSSVATPGASSGRGADAAAASCCPLALLLHEGGWDEVIMVAIGLGLAYLVIVWTGRRSGPRDDAGRRRRVWSPTTQQTIRSPSSRTSQRGRRRAATVRSRQRRTSARNSSLRYNTAQAEVAERQTRRSQKPLRATSWGFESPLRHQILRGRMARANGPVGGGWCAEAERELGPLDTRQMSGPAGGTNTPIRRAARRHDQPRLKGPPSRRSGDRVLVVEDDEAVSSLLVTLLEDPATTPSPRTTAARQSI